MAALGAYNPNVKWSPYNVGDYNNPTYYSGYNKTVDFPTKTGFYYQWGYGTTAVTDEVPRPYHPQDNVPLSPPWTIDDTNNTKYSLTNVCPAGYRVPTFNEAISVTLNGTGLTVDNYLSGYYADCYFDCRMIVSGFYVSANNDDVAYRGKLVFNTTTHASLFFPISGFRNPSLIFLGNVSHFENNTIVDAAYVNHLHFNYNDNYIGMGSSTKGIGGNVRCIRDN